MSLKVLLRQFRSALAREPARLHRPRKNIASNLVILAGDTADEGAKIAAKAALAGNLNRFEKMRARSAA